MSMAVFAGLALLLAVGVPLAIARVFRVGTPNSWAAHLAALESLLTVTALLAASAWYFIERPGAPKVAFKQSATGAPAGDGRVLVAVEVSLANVGSTPVAFRRAKYKLFVQRVTPVAGSVAREALQPAGSHGAALAPADNWPSMAALYSENPDGSRRLGATLDSFVEAGEEENLYYRVVLPCQPGLRVAVSSRFEKPPGLWSRMLGRPPLFWIKQTFVDLSEFCPAKETGA